MDKHHYERARTKEETRQLEQDLREMALRSVRRTLREQEVEVQQPIESNEGYVLRREQVQLFFTYRRGSC